MDDHTSDVVVAGKKRERRVGLAFAITSSLVWGFLPLYWQFLNTIPLAELICYRCLSSFVCFVIMLVWLQKLAPFFKLLKTPKALLWLLASSFLICLNWVLYIYALAHHRLVDTSLGYFIEPIVTVALGIVLLKEPFSIIQWVAFGLVTMGVGWVTFHEGLPILALVLAVSFSLYALVRKQLNKRYPGNDQLIFSTVEKAISSVPALGYLVYLAEQGSYMVPTASLGTQGLVALSGVLTAVPLLWFQEGVQRLPLSIVGFIQYIGPTCQLFVGCYFLKENLDIYKFQGFIVIWCALILSSVSSYYFADKNIFKKR